MEMNFCRRCGAKLAHNAGDLYICTTGHRLYACAAPTVGIFFITPANEVLLGVRGIEPFKGKYDSFGGFVDDQETFEHALVRELREELQLEPTDYDEPVYISSEISTYLYDNEYRSVLSVYYWSRLKASAQPIASDDVAGLVTMPLSDIDYTKIGNKDVHAGLHKLQKLFS